MGSTATRLQRPVPDAASPLLERRLQDYWGQGTPRSAQPQKLSLAYQSPSPEPQGACLAQQRGLEQVHSTLGLPRAP